MRAHSISRSYAFALTVGSDLDSLLGDYAGFASNVSFAADDLTGIFALECNSVSPKLSKPCCLFWQLWQPLTPKNQLGLRIS